MREMKDSGIEWIGKIPESWTLTKIKNAAQEIGSGTTPPSHILDYYDGDVFWIQSGDIYGKSEIIDTVTRVTIKAVQNLSALHIYEADFIVIAMYGGSVGNIAISKIDACTNQACCCIKPSQDINLRYLFYWIFACKDDFLQQAFGGGQPNISQSKIKNQYFLKSSLDEQKRIADYLDAKCAEIDALAADIQAQIDTLEQYKRSIITEAVTKGLNPDAEMKDSGIEWVGKIPNNWTVIPNKYIMNKVKEICPEYSGQDILSLTVNGVIVRNLDAGGKMPTSFNGYQRLWKDNLLMCLFDIDVTPRCIGLIKNDGLSSPAYSQFTLHDNAIAEYYYYNYYLMMDYTKELLHMAKNLRHSLTEDQLGAISVPVPPIEEQRKIAQYLDDKLTEINTIIDRKKEQLEVLDSYKKSLIYEYVTGKKEVPVIAD